MNENACLLEKGGIFILYMMSEEKHSRTMRVILRLVLTFEAALD